MKQAPIRALLVALLPLWLSVSACAGIDEGWAAYHRGDYATALEEFLPIANGGDPNAQFNVAFIYGNGLGVPQDYAKAVKWYRLAAEQGYANAQFNLGVMYDKGLSVPPDYAEAMRWYRLAAEQGNASAQYNLGLIYYFGKGVATDNVQAHLWWTLAAAKEHENGRKNRDIVAKRMTPADISEAQRLAREWLEEHGD